MFFKIYSKIYEGIFNQNVDLNKYRHY